MATRLGVSAQNASVAGITALLNGGTVQIRTGSQPATVGTAATGTLLGTLTLSATAFGAPTSGTASANAITGDTSADASGTAGWFRAISSGATAIIDGTITASGGGGEMIISNVNVVAGGTLDISSWSITQGAG